jgi:DNA-binding HxlR family transcriptional regulator
VFIRRKMYRELGGRSEYRATPLAELLEIKLSIIAENNVQAEREQAQKEEQARQKEAFERRMRQGGTR